MEIFENLLTQTTTENAFTHKYFGNVGSSLRCPHLDAILTHMTTSRQF
jgi:hypothetical protein